MIYDALRLAQADTTPAPNALGPVAAVGVSRRSRTRSAWIVSGLGAVAFAGIVVLALAQLDDRPATMAGVQPDAADSAVTATPAGVPADVAAGHAVPAPQAPLPAFAAVPAGHAAPLSPPDPTAVPSETVSTNTPSAPTVGDGVTGIQDAHLQIDVIRAAPASQVAADEVGALLAALDNALAAHDAQASAQLLSTLGRQLPDSSLTLLRARAWAAHSQGDSNAADTHYRAVLQRLPDDEQAGVNLALLEAARGDGDAAQARLRRLASHNGQSPLITRAMEQIAGASHP